MHVLFFCEIISESMLFSFLYSLSFSFYSIESKGVNRLRLGLFSLKMFQILVYFDRDYLIWNFIFYNLWLSLSIFSTGEHVRLHTDDFDSLNGVIPFCNIYLSICSCYGFSSFFDCAFVLSEIYLLIDLFLPRVIFVLTLVFTFVGVLKASPKYAVFILISKLSIYSIT